MPGMNYDEAISFLGDLSIGDLVNGKIKIKIDAYDLIMLIEATRVRSESTILNSKGDPVKLLSMWGETDECGMGQFVEINVAPGLNYSAVYEHVKTVRTGQ